MTDYLLKSTYTYGTKRLTDFAITTADSKTTAEFEVTYEEVFIQTGMNPQCNFVDQLQWGFRNPSSTSWYYMGPDTTVAGNPLIFTCVCLLLCLELSKEEMFCLIPKRFDDMLLIDVVTENELNANASIQLSGTGLDIYPINLTCPTFGALYRSVFQKLYDESALEVNRLNRNARSTYADHNIDQFTTNLESNKVSFELSYSKTVLEQMGVDPTCNFDQILQWGFQKAINSAGYHLGKDTTVKSNLDQGH
ncbi:hypothetical protein FBUS_02681 [Fasciolopsis buskii]|uniref:Uncharacterized protein n=1 Tax=Fasciolopsis buskii TaxID=27845 RepID=A0A8E0VPC9_9TREM|nr:hypothetical protein FBUS_02681 [Fasciolopsis buski]